MTTILPMFNFIVYSSMSDEFPVTFIASEQSGRVIFRNLISQYDSSRIAIQDISTGRAFDTGICIENLSMQEFDMILAVIRPSLTQEKE